MNKYLQKIINFWQGIPYKNYVLLFLLVGFAVYFPSLFNGFAWDDVGFIKNNPDIKYVSPALFFDNVFNGGFVYRQVPAIYFAILNVFFGPNPFGYHFVQLLLHIACTSLIFILFRRYFAKNIALILSIIFLVHPINAEAVFWISSTQSQLYVLSGVSLLLISTTKQLSFNRLIVMGILSLLCISTNETGFLFLVLLYAYRFLNKRKKYKPMIIMTTTVIGIYVYLRSLAGTIEYVVMEGVKLGDLSFFQRLFTIPAILTYYLKSLIYPINLAIWQTWYVYPPTLFNFYFPLVIVLLLLGAFLYFAFIVYKNDKRRFHLLLFFTFWLGLSLGTVLQLLPLEMTVSDRWFYFPFIGLLGIFGILFEYLPKIEKKYYGLSIAVVIILVSLFSMRTFIRGFDWKNNATLYEHDIKYNPEGYFVIHNYASELMHNGRAKEAVPYIEKLVSYYPDNALFLNELGTAYEAAGEYEKAIEVYKRAIEVIKKPTPETLAPYVNLARCLINAKRPKEAIALLNDELLHSDVGIPEFYMMRTSAALQLEDYEGAMKYATEIYMQSDDPTVISFYNNIKKQYEGKIKK